MTRLRIETRDQVGDLVAHVLAGAAGGTEAKWRKLIGSVDRVPTWRYVRFNWVVEPNGSAEQRDLIARAVDVVRAEHPYVV